MARRRLLTTDDAVPAKGQHRAPCSDCPWARASLPGWLGGLTADQWIRAAHGEERIDCHTLTGSQCAGAAVYRRNVCKRPHDKSTLVLPADREKVFATPAEFLAHHSSHPEGRARKPEKVEVCRFRSTVKYQIPPYGREIDQCRRALNVHHAGRPEFPLSEPLPEMPALDAAHHRVGAVWDIPAEVVVYSDGTFLLIPQGTQPCPVPKP